MYSPANIDLTLEWQIQQKKNSTLFVKMAFVLLSPIVVSKDQAVRLRLEDWHYLLRMSMHGPVAYQKHLFLICRALCGSHSKVGKVFVS